MRTWEKDLLLSYLGIHRSVCRSEFLADIVVVRKRAEGLMPQGVYYALWDLSSSPRTSSIIGQLECEYLNREFIGEVRKV